MECGPSSLTSFRQGSVRAAYLCALNCARYARPEVFRIAKGLLRPASSTYGITRVVRSGTEPAAVPLGFASVFRGGGPRCALKVDQLQRTQNCIENLSQHCQISNAAESTLDTCPYKTISPQRTPESLYSLARYAPDRRICAGHSDDLVRGSDRGRAGIGADALKFHGNFMFGTGKSGALLTLVKST